MNKYSFIASTMIVDGEYEDVTSLLSSDIIKELATSQDHCDFTKFFDDNSELNNLGFHKNVYLEFFEIDGTLYTKTSYVTEQDLSYDQITKLKDYTESQWSDGIGEGFEQQGIRIDDNLYYLAVWYTDVNILCVKE